MKVLFSIGHINIYFFGFMIALAALTGIYVSMKEAKRKGLDRDMIMEGCLYALLGGIIGARLAYILVYDPAYYLSNPGDIIMITSGGLSIHGGIAGGTLAALWFTKKHKLPLWKTADAIAPGLILAQGVGRVGCDVFGKVMSLPLPWGVYYNGNLVHPAQAYEFILNYLLFFYLWQIRKTPRYDGQVFTHYLIGYAIIRGLVEFTRTNPVVFGVFTVSHVLSLIMMITGVALSAYLKKNIVSANAVIKHQKNNIAANFSLSLLLMFLSLGVFYGIQSGI